MIIYGISLVFGLLVYSLVLLRLMDFAKRQDQVKNRLNKVTTTGVKGLPEEEEFSKPLLERFIKPLLSGLISNVYKYLPEDNTKSSNLESRQAGKLKNMLYHAGMKVSVNQYLKIRFLVMVGSGIIFGLIAMSLHLKIEYSLFLILMGIYAAYVVMRFDLSHRISVRKSSMQRQLPEVLDMLSVSVEAGLGLEQAMIHVVDHFKGPLIDEIAVANREMAMGRNRKDALLLLGDRCEISEMKTFVRAIVQASQLGISIKNVLRAQASFMRQTRKNKIEEKAMKVSVKILLPMAFFIFPVIFIVLLGPAAVSIFENLL